MPKEPSETLDVIAIRQEYAGQKCPICQGYGRLKCVACEKGQVPFLGGYQQCSRCCGSGIKPCPVCERRGVINEKYHSIQSNSVQESINQSKSKLSSKNPVY
ncbi:MAG: hypothetical protein ACE5JB_15990 [bacterium]